MILSRKPSLAQEFKLCSAHFGVIPCRCNDRAFYVWKQRYLYHLRKFSHCAWTYQQLMLSLVGSMLKVVTMLKNWLACKTSIGG